MTDRTVTSGRATPSVRVWIEYATVGALAFQAAHLLEHAAQLAYWFMNPTHAPWLTPWAESGQNLLVVDGTAASGSELPQEGKAADLPKGKPLFASVVGSRERRFCKRPRCSGLSSAFVSMQPASAECGRRIVGRQC